MSLRTTNLNLLPILRSLLKEASVSRAATALHLSQPATSNALNRLRQLLGDPLLIQVGRKMHLSPRAERLLPLLDGVCTTIEALLLEAEFVPFETKRSFAIATPDYVALLLGAELVSILGDVAPHVSVRFVNVLSDYKTQLGSGAADVAIVAWDDEFARGLSAMHGYMDHMVGVVAKDHPLAHQTPKSASAVAAYPHVGFDYGYQIPGHFPALNKGMKAVRGPMRLGTAHFMTLPLIAADTDCVAIVPKALADYLSGISDKTPIRTFELPGNRIVIDACILWSPLHEADSAHRWFRGILDGIMRRHFSVDGTTREAHKPIKRSSRKTSSRA